MTAELWENGTPGRIRTCGLRIRSPLLYPTELQAHIANSLITHVRIRVHRNAGLLHSGLIVADDDPGGFARFGPFL